MTVDLRAELKQVMTETVADEAQDHNASYVFARPMPVPTIRRAYVRGGKWRADCSTGVRDVCWWVPNAPDPFGNGWQPWGNSSTIWAHLHHEDDLAKCEVGDYFTFGHWTGEEHVAMAFNDMPATPTNDLALWNFGRQGQPIISTLALEIAAHPGMTVTLCKNPIVDPPMTPQDKLRAMTGFYSWVAWRLGEGPWKHYGVTNAKVRPNVPKRISAQWWARYVQFLNNRHKGNP